MVLIALDAGRLAFWLSVSLIASLAALGVAIASGYATASINRSKGRSPRAGFWLGFCFPLVAIAVAASFPGRATRPMVPPSVRLVCPAVAR